MTLIFKEKQHEYWLDGIKLPSVTGIIEPLSDVGKVPANILLPRSIRGTNIHKMVEHDLQGILDYDSLNDEFKRIHEQLQIFKKVEGPNFDFDSAYLEYPMAHKRLKYAGTPDIICDAHAMIDIKATEFNAHIVPLQVVPYEKLWVNDVGIKAKYEHFKLILDKDHYKFTKLETKGAWSKFRELLDYYWYVRDFKQKIKQW